MKKKMFPQPAKNTGKRKKRSDKTDMIEFYGKIISDLEDQVLTQRAIIESFRAVNERTHNVFELQKKLELSTREIHDAYFKASKYMYSVWFQN